MSGDQRLATTAARGAATMLAAQIVRIGIQTLGIVILARLLSPEDYGLMAMVTVVASFADIFRDFGLSAAAVQAKTLTRGQRTNLWWANTLIGLAIAILVAGCSPVVAAAFKEPRLTDLVRVMALSFVINGAATQYRASLTRSMRFASVAWTEVFAQVLGLIAGVSLALASWGYWALAAMQLASALTIMVTLMILSRWLPGLPRRGEAMGGLVRFGTFLMASQVVTYASNNIDSMVLGRRFGAEVVGLYDRPYRLLMMPLAQIRAPSTSVALPVLSRLQDDPARYGHFILRGQLALGLVLVVPLGLVAGAAQPVVDVFLGSAWSAGAPILALLAIAGAMKTLAFVAYWVYLSKALTKALFQFTMLTSGLTILLVLIGGGWGAVGVAAAVALSPALTWPLALWWLSRLTPLPLRGLVLGGLRILVLSALVGVGARLVVVFTAEHQMAAAAQLALALIVGAAVFIAVAWLVPALRRDVLSFLPTVRGALRRRSA